jgi:hypothetical protein
MTIETEVAALTASTTALTTAVATQQTGVNTAVAAFTTTIARVDALEDVENTADADKPVSTPQQTALNAKQDTLVSGVNISTVNGVSLLGGNALVIARGAVEVPEMDYDNRADLRTPVAPVPLNGDVVNMPHLGLFQYSTLFEYIDDDEMVFEAVDPTDGTTPIGQWVLTLPGFEFLQAQEMYEDARLLDFIEDEELRHVEHGH